MELRGKTALVTGAAKRVGKAIAVALAVKGVSIFLHYNTSEEEANETASQIQALGVDCTLLQADLASTEEITQLLDKISQKKTPVDILINSASAFYRTPIQEAQHSDLETFLKIHTEAPFLLSKELGIKMSQKGSGKIVNIADWSGFRPYKGYVPYCTSKGGLITLTKALAQDLAPKVTVNAIAPGPVLLPPSFSADEKKTLEKKTPLGRIGSPEDVSNAVIFLLENDYMTGTVLTVDGGRSLA